MGASVAEALEPQKDIPRRAARKLRRLYQDVLVSLLLNGPIVVPRSDTFLEEWDLTRLGREGLVVFRDFDHSIHLRRRTHALYETAFALYRRLEDMGFGPFVPLSPRSVKTDPVEVAAILGDLEFYDAQLRRIVFDAADSLGPVFELIFYQNIDFLAGVMIEALNDEAWRWLMSDREETRDAAHFDMRAALGLEVITAEEYEAAPYRRASFYPDDLGVDPSFVEAALYGRYGHEIRAKLMAIATSEFRKSMYDYLRARAYFESFFEIINLSTEAQKESDCLFLPSTSRLRAQSALSEFTPGSEDLSQIYRVYLTQANSIPRLERIEDLLRLRDDKAISSLREQLATWNNTAGQASEPKLIQEIRRDIEAAAKGIKKYERFKEWTRVASYIALPVGLAEAIFGIPAISLGISVVGTAFDYYADLKINKLHWIRFGT
jgi:hypothetical protein